MDRLRIVALVGTTASGKARLALEAAKEVGAEILSCDSMKVYREMDVGTAKPGPAARAAVRWHALDLVEPHERFDATSWTELALTALRDARERRVPILVTGGTVLYLKALTEGIFAGPPRDPLVRAALKERAEKEGLQALHEELVQKDSVAAAKIHPHDYRRIERALEVHALTGKPISELQAHTFGRIRDGIERKTFALALRRDDLDQRIGRRIDRMIAEGWVEEARRLAARAQGISREAAQALGYSELLAYVRAGEKDPLDPVVTSIKTSTRRFARRQLNWLRHHVEGLESLDVPHGAEPCELYRDTIVRALRHSLE